MPTAVFFYREQASEATDGRVGLWGGTFAKLGVFGESWVGQIVPPIFPRDIGTGNNGLRSLEHDYDVNAFIVPQEELEESRKK